MIETKTVTVAVWPYPSVTTHCAVPESVEPDAGDAVNDVDDAFGVLIEIPAPPLCQLHAYVYDPDPPDADTAAVPVVIVAAELESEIDDGDAVAETVVTRAILTDTVAVADCP